MKIRDETGGNFTKVHNTILRDPSLSYKAKGLFVDMLSLPDDWVYTVAGMVKRSTDGRDSIYKALRELEDAGYIMRRQSRSGGKFSATEYDIIETPHTETPHTETPHTETPHTETPHTETPHTETPHTETPYTETPHTETPYTEKPTLLNTNLPNTKDNKILYNKIPPLSPTGETAPTAAEKKKPKGDRAKLNEIIAEQPEELQEPLREFVKMRSNMKKPLTPHALELNIKTLYNLSNDPKERVDIVEQSVMRSYQGFWPIKDDNTNAKYANGNNDSGTSNPFLKYTIGELT